MARRVTITLQEENLAFVDREASRGGKASRSQIIDAIVTRERRRALKAELKAAYRRDAVDPAYLEEIGAWDTVAGDGVGG